MEDDIDYVVTQQAARDGIYIGIEGGGTKSLKKYPHKEARDIVRRYVGDHPLIENRGSRIVSRRRRAKAASRSAVRRPAAPTTKLNQLP